MLLFPPLGSRFSDPFTRRFSQSIFQILQPRCATNFAAVLFVSVLVCHFVTVKLTIIVAVEHLDYSADLLFWEAELAVVLQ